MAPGSILPGLRCKLQSCRSLSFLGSGFDLSKWFSSLRYTGTKKEDILHDYLK